jgi:hypothetical protein
LLTQVPLGLALAHEAMAMAGLTIAVLHTEPSMMAGAAVQAHRPPHWRAAERRP